MLVREKDPIGPSNVRASAVTAPSTAANSDLARPRNVAFGSQPVKLGMSICRLFDAQQQTFAADGSSSKRITPMKHRAENPKLRLLQLLSTH